MKVYIGFDSEELAAVRVAEQTLLEVSPGLEAELLMRSKLAVQGLLNRPVDRRGRMYDLHSNAPQSTDFAISRFLVPIVCQERWALFTDCDVVFLENPLNILDEVEKGKAVYVVKHNYTPSGEWKMVNQQQVSYTRKNWSSVMLFDCHHPANWRLSLRDVNERAGIDLHQFYWLNDNEIGELDGRWNWLVGEQERAPQNEGRGIAHFTLGGPWLQGWKGGHHDELWLAAADKIGLNPR